jgi:hypothetical protein
VSQTSSPIVCVVSLFDDAMYFLCAASDIMTMKTVIKTTKQTAGLGDDGKKEISYKEALALVIENDGVLGLFGRGLQTRLLTNAIQGALFSVLWKYFQVTI